MTTTLDVRLRRPHAGQARVIAEARRFNVVNCGRRFGKSTLGIDRTAGPLLAGQPVGWFSPTYRMVTEVWRELKATYRDVTRHVSEQEKRIELVTGGVLDIWSLDAPDVARGRKYRRIIVDEAAMIRALEAAWNAVLRPTLADYEGDAWFLSTPKGRNFYWSLWRRGQDELLPDWMSWSMPSTANPHVPASEFDALRRELPERIYRQEVLAAFLEDGGGVFRGVMEAAIAERQDAAAPGRQYVMGVDWGKHNDFTVLAVIDATSGDLAELDRFNQIDYAVQTTRLRALADRFRPTTAVVERNSIGEPLIEQLQRDGLHVTPFLTTNASKAVAIDALALAFERRVLRIINDPVLVGELLAYEAERLPSGLLRYGAPPGQHDDCVMALALAWQAATIPPPAAVTAEPVDIRRAYGADRGALVRRGIR